MWHKCGETVELIISLNHIGVTTPQTPGGADIILFPMTKIMILKHTYCDAIIWPDKYVQSCSISMDPNMHSYSS
jgi:hypothetical protein